MAIAFQLSFRICQKEGPRKSGRTGIEWNTSAPGLCYIIYSMKTQTPKRTEKFCYEASWKVGLEVNTEKNMYVCLATKMQYEIAIY
jgi:hypothetical protein